MDHRVRLKIADTVIAMQSRFSLENMADKGDGLQFPERFNNFFYTGSGKSDILIDVEVVDKLPQIHKAEPVFITYHFQDGEENWRLLKKHKTYIYRCPLKNKRQLMLVNKTFDKVTAYLLPKKDKARVWNTGDIIYDFLQVLLINYFAQRNSGLFIHAIGIKDVGGKGLLFAGKSGCGKTATARLWHKHSKAMVLNDDRIIVRKANSKFSIFGSPWHGEFSDYLTSRIESAPLKKLFFIYHASKNRARRISKREAFRLLYPALFPTFWDKGCLENIVSMSYDLIENVPCYRFGFLNDKRVIRFARKI